MIIVGAGMAGLLCANMLARRRPIVMEQQKALPNNHSAVLRFRSTVVGDVLGIPFRRVSMIKSPVVWQNPVSDSLAYSYKCTGQYLSDRSITLGTVIQERYIAPPDLISRMAENADLSFDQRFTWAETDTEGPPVISTLPMPVLMRILNYPDIPRFYYVNGFNIKAQVKTCDAFVSLLIPDPSLPMSRISITGNELIIEMPRAENAVLDKLEGIIEYAAGALGIEKELIEAIQVHQQLYAKIVGIDNDVRKRFIAWATDQHNIYSLGRYATWRPNLLLDDLVKDVRCIDSWISTPDRYALKQHRAAG